MRTPLVSPIGLLKGFRTFNEFLGSDEGIASNILADRLTKLEAAGTLTRSTDAATHAAINIG